MFLLVTPLYCHRVLVQLHRALVDRGLALVDSGGLRDWSGSGLVVGARRTLARFSGPLLGGLAARTSA